MPPADSARPRCAWYHLGVARDPDVPRLPRGRGISLTGPQMFKIVFFAALLVAVIVLQRPCAEAAGRFVGQFDETKDAGVKPAPPRPPPGHELPPGNYVEIKPGMTDEEIRQAIDRASPGSGSGAASGSAAASGSGAASNAP